jgi:hypothetical protein
MSKFKEPDMIDFFPVLVVKETEKAMRIQYMGEQFWAPKSIINVARRDQDGKVTHIQLPDWFTKKENLEP